jgi:hypothetical protein
MGKVAKCDRVFTFEEIRASDTLRLRLNHERADYCVRSLSS